MDARKETHCDLLIIGAGPAGLMAATWASRLQIGTRIIDKRGTKVFNGQADGLQCRSLEIFDSFGFADRVWKESNHMLEICFWNPDENGQIRRTDRLPDTIPGISRFHEVVLHQGRIERFFLDSLKNHSNISVERGVLPEDIQVDESATANDLQAHPVTVKLRHLSEEEATPAQNSSNIPDGLFRSSLAEDDSDDLIGRNGSGEAGSETVHAKYVIDATGAHSWTRRRLGFKMEGEQTDFIWGVLDVIPITDFPDIRCRCAIHSSDSGSMMVIPRENKLVRFYIQLLETGENSGKIDRSTINPDLILKAAQKIIAPYKLDFHYIDWLTGYQIGQRVSDRFTFGDRIFLVGDAVHTHSPKAGQGMNVSMQDSYNLGWKIGLVAKGLANPEILKTYQSERRSIAQELIDFDHKFSRLFSGRPSKDAADEAGISMEEFKSVFLKGAMFASGLSVKYGSNLLVAEDNALISNGDAANEKGSASKIKLGMRFPSAQVLNQSSARPWQFAHFLRSDGRFRIVLFAGDLQKRAQLERLKHFCDKLASPESFLHRFTPSGKQIDSTIELLTIHSGSRTSIELLDLPEILHPFDEKTGWDYDKVFVDDVSYHEGYGDAYAKYGVDKERGRVVILRPDQHVAWIGEFEDVEAIEAYFSRVLVPQR